MPKSLHPPPSTFEPCTLHPLPYTPNVAYALYTLHLNPEPYTLHPTL